MKMTKIAIAAMAMAGALAAQVAQQANSGYQTEAARKSVAKSLADPSREQTQKPGQLVVAMGLQPGMTVADVGTGVGYMLPYLSKRVGPAGHVIAEDIFDDFLAAARQTVENSNLKNARYHMRLAD